MVEIIEVKNLVKRYKKAEKNAVDDVSFSVKAGEFFSLLGPNGAGKTTTISILTTTLSKTSGKITVAGYDLDKNQDKVRQSVGIIFQNPSLDLNLTAEENIRFHAILYGLYPFSPLFNFMPKKYRNEVYQLAELIGIKDELFKPIKTFSGGMKRKLEIIRSLIHHPKVLFLDEPTVGLDPLSRKNLWEYLIDIREKEKLTLFLTTHYLEEAEPADNVAIINNGKIITRGTPDEIKKRIVKDYLMVDSKNKEGLVEELKKHRYDFETNNQIKINLGKKSVQEVISSIKTPLSSVRTHTPTIEEAYLEIIGEDQKNHSE
ncbi:MAG: ABC transporter ATP-binding protein [Candidatus Levyibacteriota bacterium]